jgi:tetratricopeptide (TPR) repeat protein
MSKRTSEAGANQQRYLKALEAYGRPPQWPWKKLMVAICLTQLGDYPKAQHSYSLALQGSLEDREWHSSGQVNWLADTYVMADQPTFFPRVWEEVEAYKLDPRGDALWALYGYSLVRLISSKDQEAADYAPGLLKKPQAKDCFAMGKTIQAIIERDQPAFGAALDSLLNAHRGMAKFGGLRETAEGFLCLPAMSLSRMARERGMTVSAESEYLCMGYLDYLQGQAFCPEG